MKRQFYISIETTSGEYVGSIGRSEDVKMLNAEQSILIKRQLNEIFSAYSISAGNRPIVAMIKEDVL